MFVYAIVCRATLKIYIGQHKGLDLGKYLSKKFFDARRYVGKRSHLYAAMRQHPRDTWSIHPLVSGITDKKELDETEQLLIYALNAQHPNVGYNICDGGEGFTGPQSPEAKAKISAALIGRPVSAATRAKIGAANIGLRLGQKASEETKSKMSKTQQARYDAGFQSTSGMIGRHHSESTLEKMKRPHHMSPEGLDAIRAARAAKKGKPWSAAQRATSSNPTGVGRMSGAERQARHRAKNKTISVISEE